MTISSFPDMVSDDEVAEFQREFFISFGRFLDDTELVAARFAYSRVWDLHPVEKPGGNAVPGHRALKMDAFQNEPDIVRLIANPFMIRLAASLLKLPQDGIEYAGGWIHSQRVLKQWTYEEWGSSHWHVDAQPSLDDPEHVNVWIYLDDCTREDGVTQVLKGGCEVQRENVRQNRHTDVGIGEMWADQDSCETGTWAEGPAGGGFAWTGFAYHRISPNISGRPRRLITYEFRKRLDDGADGSMFREQASSETKKTMRATLPEEFQYLVPR